ncbi:MAG: TetR/AcrR family transcriptional regulator, partial [Actinomycetota bacterium]|nr:TetR/AcrR family transcriptional regulator [Actinomycetota bacterium]
MNRPGRKRSEESRRAILAAALELAVEVGYAGLTVEGIAARSGAGKQTIYRWWPSKADVVLDALAAKSDHVVPLPDTGDYREDLRQFLLSSFAAARNPDLATLLRALMAQAQLDADFGQRFRHGFLHHRRDALRVVLDRAVERGQLPDGLSPDTVADVVFGVIWY